MFQCKIVRLNKSFYTCSGALAKLNGLKSVNVMARDQKKFIALPENNLFLIFENTQ